MNPNEKRITAGAGMSASISRYGKMATQPTTATPKLGLYTTILLTRKLEIPFRIIGRNVKDTLEHILLENRGRKVYGGRFYSTRECQNTYLFERLSSRKERDIRSCV